MAKKVEVVATVLLFVAHNVRTKHNRVADVQVLHVVANVPQSVRGIQKVVVAQVLHVVLNARQSVKNRHHRVVRIVVTIVVQVVLPNVRTLVILDATQDAQAIVQTHAKQDVNQDATTLVAALVHT